MEIEVANTIYVRFLKEFMDILILVNMKQGETSGYDTLTFFHEKFNLMISPGTVYSLLYSMERNGLIKARGVGGKRVYTLTSGGEATVKGIRESSGVLERFLVRLSEECNPSSIDQRDFDSFARAALSRN